MRLPHKQEDVGSTPAAATTCGDSVTANISVSKTEALSSNLSLRAFHGAVGKLVKPLDFRSSDCGFEPRQHF